MSKVFMSLDKGFHRANPQCFRCGDCCARIPPELTKEEINLISSRLNESERKLFLESLTTNAAVADPIDVVRTALSKAAWIKAPCLFLYFEKGRKNGKIRSACKIYKFRPEICRVFHCGKNSEDEPLLYRRYKYELTPHFTQALEESKEFDQEGWKKILEMIREAEWK